MNLQDNVLEVFRQPSGETYLDQRIMRPEDKIAPQAFPDVELRVGDYLP